MSDNWKNEGQNKMEYDKNKQGEQEDQSKRPGQSGEHQPGQRKDDKTSQRDQNEGQKKAS